MVHHTARGKCYQKNAPRPQSWGIDEKELVLRGLLIDRITEIIQLPWRAQVSGRDNKCAAIVLEAEERCLALSKQIYNAPGKVPKQHMRTLVAGMTHDRYKYPRRHLVHDYQATIRTYRELVLGKIRHDEVDYQTLKSIARYQNPMIAFWEHSCFFTTEGGRIGIGPETMLPGDDVCIVITASTPYVLRSNTQDEIYRFQGPAYVEGLTDGSVFHKRRKKETYREFRIL